MKKLITLILMMGFLGSFAQEPIEVKIEERPSSQGVVPAFEVVVPQATEKDAIDLWKKTIMPRGLLKKNPKMEKVKDEWIVRDLVISDITTMPVNVYTQVSTFPGNIYVRVFLQSEGGFIGSRGSAQNTVDAASQFVRNYAVDLYKLAVEKELKQEENKLKAAENDLKKMQRKNKSFNKKVNDAQKEQSTLSEEVRQKEEFLRNSAETIELEPGDGKKTQKEILEKELKSSEKELKKAKKAQSKYERKISKIKRQEREKEDEISKQKDKVKEVETKLKNIR
ncbi:MAG: hypothetical protein WBK43_01195 [Prolixibacteraceae bacterium]|nr:hypothetical protein [Prolixibacteraceae bacterium]OQB82203.1 MAG: hypothetical protein BWX87_00076 [Bacteroidetes bacterium ADurb.Bin123]HNZ69840.1 hypothetical protein [Prolixibacteraceae bacterium]HOF54674.1 hypothetical protein [Prolixibacteraceae bacterium]HOR99644.1 hypothetical protein [Prolixibacteraceae bacterium]